MFARLVFWGSLGALAWTQVGYPIAAELAARVRPRPVRKDDAAAIRPGPARRSGEFEDGFERG